MLTLLSFERRVGTTLRRALAVRSVLDVALDRPTRSAAILMPRMVHQRHHRQHHGHFDQHNRYSERKGNALARALAERAGPLRAARPSAYRCWATPHNFIAAARPGSNRW